MIRASAYLHYLSKTFVSLQLPLLILFPILWLFTYYQIFYFSPCWFIKLVLKWSCLMHRTRYAPLGSKFFFEFNGIGYFPLKLFYLHTPRFYSNLPSLYSHQNYNLNVYSTHYRTALTSNYRTHLFLTDWNKFSQRARFPLENFVRYVYLIISKPAITFYLH